MLNLPATSKPNIMKRYPRVRYNECQRLLKDISFFEHCTVLDIQSAAGFVADTIYSQLDKKVQCICLEPSNALRKRIAKHHISINNPVEDFYSIKDNTIDIAVGLAGLHHSNNHQKTVNETFRVLKNGATIALCDVEKNSNIAKWLNGFVNAHNTCGHVGHFIEQGDMSQYLTLAGFESITEEVANVPWIFENWESCLLFIRDFFSIKCPRSTLENAIHEHFNIIEHNDHIELPWQLIYSQAKKPTTQIKTL